MTWMSMDLMNRYHTCIAAELQKNTLAHGIKRMIFEFIDTLYLYGEIRLNLGPIPGKVNCQQCPVESGCS